MRPRPLNALERGKAGDKACVHVEGNVVAFAPSALSTGEPPKFTFDSILSPTSSQAQLYDLVGPKAIQGSCLG